MSLTKKAVYFFCPNLDIDPVAGRVFGAVSEMYSLFEADIIIDDYPVLKHLDDKGNEFYFVRTGKVVCHDYRYYLPIMNRYFSGFDMAGLVTWHEGQNAPDRILSVHTTGDVETGYFGNANPVYMHNLLWSLEKNRIAAGLEDFRITTEATHWSGMIHNGGTPDMIPQFPVPLVDIEIGARHPVGPITRHQKLSLMPLPTFLTAAAKTLKTCFAWAGFTLNRLLQAQRCRLGRTMPLVYPT